MSLLRTTILVLLLVSSLPVHAGLGAELDNLVPEFLVRSGGSLNSDNNTLLPDPAMATGPNGTFAVAWTEKTHWQNDAASILVRRYAANGTPLDDSPIIVNDNYMSDYRHVTPAIAMDDDGYLIVTWLEQNPAAGTAAKDCEGNLRMRAINDSGEMPYPSWNVLDDAQASGGGSALSDKPGGPRDFLAQNCRPDLANNGNGLFAVVWEHKGSPDQIMALPLDRANVEQALEDQENNDPPQRPELGAPGQVNTIEDAQPRTRARVAMDQDGQFAVAWLSPEQDHQDYPSEDIHRAWVRRFDFAKNPYSPLDTQEFRADDGALPGDALALQSDVDLAMTPTGDFAVVWHEADLRYITSNDIDNPKYSVKGQRFTADGVAGDAFSTPVLNQNRYTTPSILLDEQDNLLFGWTEQVEGSTSQFNIMAQMPFGADTSTVQLNDETISASSLQYVQGPLLGYEVGNLVAAWIARDNNTDSAPNSNIERLSVMSTALRVDSIVRESPTEELTSADSVTFTVTFSESVQNVDATDFSASLGSVTTVNGSGNSWSVTVGSGIGSADGDLNLEIDSGHDITDTAGDQLSDTSPKGSNESYILDNTAPSLNSAVVNGTTLTLDYNETLDSASVPATNDYTVKVNGTEVTLSNLKLSGSDINITLETAVEDGDTVTLDYSIGTYPVQDTVGNTASALSDQNISNNDDGSGNGGSSGGGGGSDSDDGFLGIGGSPALVLMGLLLWRRRSRA